MLEKVISGGQTGADEAGLIAAKKCGIATGGTMPKNYRTEDGNRPDFVELYGVQEHAVYHYGPRTFCNAKEGDGTIRLAYNFTTAGEKLTLKAANQFGKPVFDVDMNDPCDYKEVVKWIRDNNIKVLNVAGNSASKCPLSFPNAVVDYLVKVFTEASGD